MQKPFYIDDIEALRKKLADAERNKTLIGQVWSSVRRRAQYAPEKYPWHTPFVALVTGDPRDIENAKDAIRGYLATLEPQSFGMGLQFHFWCFAFPHARWALYFQWLASMGAWDPEEEKRIREELITFQYINFFTGMRTKPEPECVDNQTMSLCYSNALLGHLFGGQSAIARRMYEDGMRRLPSIIGGLPTSGYSGEGSAYMDGVVGPSIPFIVELLERTTGGDWFNKSLPPHGGSADTVCRMIAREWMPCGLVLPWDDYGYAIPVHSCIAYAAQRTNDPLYGELLEHHANWALDQNIGWGYDDLIWSLIWWPENMPLNPVPFACWSEPEVGAALVSDDAQLYVLQMWDESAPIHPTRAHVNPNSLVFCAYGSPLSVDGSTSSECKAFKFDDTWREVGYMDLGEKRKFNFGKGCGGGHSVLLVDQWEGMRAFSEYRQATQLAFSESEKSVLTDVTPVYREKAPDAIAVQRRTRLCCERFWLIEDLAKFESEHHVTARFFLRPGQIDTARGVAIETAEGVRLTLLPLLGSDDKTVTPIPGFPQQLDGESLQIDFTQRGAECRWLWLAWPEPTRQVHADVSDHWQAAPDPKENLNLEEARQQLGTSNIEVPLTRPPYLLRDLPIVRRWWFRRSMAVPAGTASWLRLPKGMDNLRLWMDGEEVDLSPHRLRMNLLEPDISIASKWSGKTIEVTLCCDTAHAQYTEGCEFYGSPALLVEQPAPGIEHAEYRDGVVTVRSGGKEWTVAHTLLEVSR